MSLRDMVGPVMVGPSSSHTAGACRLALLARHLLLRPPTRARVTLHGSFAKTAHGHGTDLALAGGLLGAFPDDPRIPDAFTHAQRAGLAVEFTSADLGDVHPNTVRLELANDDEGNIATLHCARRKRGGEAMMSVEIDRRLAGYALDYLARLPYVSWSRMLPEVLNGEVHDTADMPAGAPA